MICFGSFFDCHFITGPTLNATPPTEVLKKTSNASLINHSPTTRTGVLDTPACWIPAWRQLLHPIKVGRTSQRPAPAPQATITSVVAGSARLRYVTYYWYTTGTTPTVRGAPTTCDGTALMISCCSAPSSTGSSKINQFAMLRCMIVLGVG